MPVSWPTIVDYATGVLNPTRWNKALGDLIKAYIDDQISTKGVPPGGATNDILHKASATDYDDAWTDAPTLDSVTLDTAAAEATGIAKIYWDATEGTVAFGMPGGVVTQQIGRHEFVRCKNTTASPITRGQVVYLTGAQGDRPTIALADATDESTSADTIGVAAEDIAVSAEGEICISGILANVNTYGLTAGVMTYLSETAGAWTQTRPTQPAHGVRLGIPLKISNSPSGNSGVFYVQVNNGYELEELHDVLVTSPAAYDILQRNATNTLWVNTPSSSITIGTAADLGGGTAGQIPYQASPGDTQFFGPGTAGDLLKSNGTSAPTYSAPAALTKTDDTNVTLTLGGNASTALVNAASITAGWTGQLAISRGGTGASTQQGALNALAGAVTSGHYLRGNGTNVVLSAIQAGDVPTLNQNTTGSAATLTTTRTLWGQNFNGSANVTGALTSVTSIDMSGNLTLSAGQINFGSGPIGALYLSSNRLTVRSESTNDVANFASYGLYLPKTGEIAGLYVESPIEARGGLRMGNSAANGTITVGAATANTANRLVQRDSNQDVYVNNTYATGWFRNYGVTGLYNQTYSRGIIEAQAGGVTYGNMTTYGGGYNGWDGWSIGSTSTNSVSFMSRPSVRDWGIHDSVRGWAIYQNPSAHGGISIGGSSPLSGYVLRVEGSLYVNSGIAMASNGSITYGATVSNTANRLVERDGSGHIYYQYGFGAYHNQSSANSENPTISQFWTQSPSDNYARKSSAQHVINQLGLLSNYGTSYYQANTWVQFNGNYGSWWPGASGWSSSPHLYPSTSQSYGSLEVEGIKNSYTGLSIRDGSNKRHYLIGESGNFGLLLNNSTIWAMYYYAAGNNIGYGGSTTVSGYSHTFSGAAWFRNAVYVDSAITASGTKSFDIKHPVAPTKRLRYAAIEGPRVDVLHRGVTTVCGRAQVDLDEAAGLLPGTSAALLRDPQCHLTLVEGPFCHMRGTVKGTTLYLETSTIRPVEIAWLVLGERQDDEIKATEGTDHEGRLITEYEVDPTKGQLTKGASRVH